MNPRSFGRKLGCMLILLAGLLCFPPTAGAQGNFTTGLESAIDELVGLIGTGANNGMPMNDMKKLDHALRDLLRVLEDMDSDSGNGNGDQGGLSNGLQSAQQGSQGKGKGKSKHHHHHHGQLSNGLQIGASSGSTPSSGSGSSSTALALKSVSPGATSSTLGKSGGLAVGMRTAGQQFSSRIVSGGSVNIVMNVKNISITENFFGNRPGSSVGQASKSGSSPSGTNLVLNLNNTQKTIGSLSSTHGGKTGSNGGSGTAAGNSLLTMPAGFQSGTAKSGKTTSGNTTKGGSSTTVAANNPQAKGNGAITTQKQTGNNKGSTKKGQVHQVANNTSAGGNVPSMNTGAKQLTSMGQSKNFGGPLSQFTNNVNTSATGGSAGKQHSTKTGKTNTHKSSAGGLSQNSTGGNHHTAHVSVAKKAGNQQGLGGAHVAHHSSSVAKNNGKKK
jgi:hypothetical protein